MNKQTVFVLILCILALGAFLRFYGITEIPLGLYHDEAMNGNNALEALRTGDFKVFYPENNGREGLFINIQALSLWLFGNEPWALRMVSALFGTITILGLFFLTRELFKFGEFKLSAESSTSKILSRGEIIALLSTFFLATSYWHLNFSRIGFRAILMVFFATFAMYFLLRALREGTRALAVIAAALASLGLYTYIGYRFMIFVFAIPLLWYLWGWWSDRKTQNSEFRTQSSCVPCIVGLFVLVAIATSTPLALYFIDHPQSLANRVNQVSIFSAPNPLFEFVKSNALTLRMFFIRGDCNWRHNYDCQPALNPVVAFFFVVGCVVAFRKRNPREVGLPEGSPTSKNLDLELGILFAWLVIMSLPATLTRESMPHALRSLGMIPPIMILAGLGAYAVWSAVHDWLERKKIEASAYAGQIERIKKEALVLFMLVLLSIPLKTYIDYFVRWAAHPETYFAFNTSLVHIGEFLNAEEPETKKYIVVNAIGDIARGVPMQAQTIMFITDTFEDAKQREKNVRYLTAEEALAFSPPSGERVVFAFVEGKDIELIKKIHSHLPSFNLRVPSDFVTIKNY